MRDYVRYLKPMHKAGIRQSRLWRSVSEPFVESLFYPAGKQEYRHCTLLTVASLHQQRVALYYDYLVNDESLTLDAQRRHGSFDLHR